MQKKNVWKRKQSMKSMWETHKGSTARHLTWICQEQAVLKRVKNQHPCSAKQQTTLHPPGVLLCTTAFLNDNFLSFQMGHHGQSNSACNRVSITWPVSICLGSMHLRGYWRGSHSLMCGCSLRHDAGARGRRKTMEVSTNSTYSTA